MVERRADRVRTLPLGGRQARRRPRRRSAWWRTCRSSSSPIQIGTRGRFQDDAFTVTGRIVYEYEHGTWNEWHVVFADDSSGWLSDAQAEYAVSRLVPKAGVPARRSPTWRSGRPIAFGDFSFQLTTLTRAQYRGVEGELPFEYWDKARRAVCGLAHGRRALRHARLLGDAAAAVSRRVRAVRRSRAQGPSRARCRASGEDRRVQLPQLRRGHRAAGRGAHQVGGVHQLRGDSGAERPERPDPPGGAGARALRAEDPAWARAGHWRGHPFEVIGYQYRYIVVEDEQYGWEEYLLFNREQGFRYLSEYQGHWNDITTLRALPESTSASGRPAARYGGRTFQACSRRRRRPPTSCSASFRGACGRTTSPA